MEKRDKTIDILKGTAIILMVLGHVIQSIYAPDSYDENLIFKFIYSFHMPLFIFISGYLTGLKRKFSINWLFDRAKRLAVPFVVWGILEYILDAGENVSIEGIVATLQRLYIDPSDRGLWFLWILFLCSIYIFFTQKINVKLLSYLKDISKAKAVEVILAIMELVLLGVVWAAVNFTTRLGMRLLCKEIIYYMVGFYVSRYKDTWENIFALHANGMIRRSRNLIYLIFPCTVLLWDRTHFIIFYQEISLISEPYIIVKLLLTLLSVLYYYMVSFLGICFMWTLAKKVQEYIPCSTLQMIGTYTMEIYILHYHFFTNLTANRTVDAILSLCVGVLVPFIIGRICERYVPFVASVLFGRKR